MTNKRRSLFIGDELWDDCQKAAAKVQLETGKPTSVAEWIRRSLQSQLDREFCPTD